VKENMSRMLLLVPRMYTEAEFMRLVGTLPGDFESKTLEFWDYVNDKLQVFTNRVKRVYRDEVYQFGEEALAYLSSIDRSNYLVVKKLVESGAVFESTEDSMLVSESKAWLEMVESQPLNAVASEFYQETVRERDGYVSKRIGETLADDEVGVLFIEPSRRITLDERFKIIKVCRFDPADYLRSWQIQRALSK